MDYSVLIEVCEEQAILSFGSDVGGGAVSMATPNSQLLLAAGYSKEGENLKISYSGFVFLIGRVPKFYYYLQINFGCTESSWFWSTRARI